MTASAISLRHFVSDLAGDLRHERFHPLTHDQVWTGMYRMRLAAEAGDARTVAETAGVVSAIVERARGARR